MTAVNGPSDGGRYIDTLDVDDPGYQRDMMRPIEVKEDVRKMEERKRVKLILHSKAFCEELQELVLEQLQPAAKSLLMTGAGSSSFISQQLSDIVAAQGRAGATVRKGASPCIPIADVRELDLRDYDKGERLFRCKMAALYRLVDLFGWSHGIQSYITGRITQDFEHFLIAPYGLMHHEVTASSLVKVDMRGDILDPGSTPLGVNKMGFSLHSAIYAARPDIKCVLHMRSTPALSISAINSGLLALCKESAVIGETSVFEYQGGALDMEQKDRLRRALGPINKVFILRNFGIVVGGETIEEAFFLARNVMVSVDFQLQSLREGKKLQPLTSEEKRAAVESANQSLVGQDGRRWRVGEEEFELLMRYLDNYGYRSGYMYRDDVEKKANQDGVSNADVVVPPASTSYISEEGGGRVGSPTKGSKLAKGQRSDFSSYEGGRFDETLNTTKTSKWMPENTSTPIKPDGSGQKTVIKTERHLETTLAEDRAGAGEPVATEYQLSSRTVQSSQNEPNSPQKSISSGDAVLHDRETSPERSGRDTPGSTKDKKKKKWPFGSKKKEKQ